MKAMSGKELAILPARNGWTLLRVHGSHHIYGRSGNIVRLSVPVHGNKPQERGLLRHLLKTAGLSEADLG